MVIQQRIEQEAVAAVHPQWMEIEGFRSEGCAKFLQIQNGPLVLACQSQELWANLLAILRKARVPRTPSRENGLRNVEATVQIS